ncbi:MAG: DUF4282 domain-containing protein [Pseudomonadota bacterium]
MQALLDFLSFKSFISPSILMACYYCGAVAMPMVMLGIVFWGRRTMRQQGFAPEDLSLWTRWATHRNQLVVLAIFLFIFLMMQIGWRMMFEFMLAYFQMRDALLLMTQP